MSCLKNLMSIHTQEGNIFKITMHYYQRKKTLKLSQPYNIYIPERFTFLHNMEIHIRKLLQHIKILRLQEPANNIQHGMHHSFCYGRTKEIVKQELVHKRI